MLGLLAATLLLGGCTGQHTTRTAASTTYTPHIKASSQDVLDGAINADEPGCSAAVGVEGKVIWSGVRGIADLASGAKITTDTVFDIASVSKQFTATAILLLVEAGKLTLDDPISQYVPELPDWAQTVTVEQLMHQTSGIPDYVALLAARGVSGQRPHHRGRSPAGVSGRPRAAIQAWHQVRLLQLQLLAARRDCPPRIGTTAA